MQTGGPWVEPPDATVVMETGFAGRIAYPETGVTYNHSGDKFLRIFPVTDLRGNAPDIRGHLPLIQWSVDGWLKLAPAELIIIMG